MVKLYFTLFTIFLTWNAIAQVPPWIDFQKRQSNYPTTEYFSGFSTSKTQKGESEYDLLERLKESATSELIESVQVTVQSLSTLHTIETIGNFQEEYKQAISSFSRIDLAGLQTETFYDKKKKTGYAFAYVKKDDLTNYYQDQLTMKKAEIDQLINKADQFVKMNDEENALKTYFDCKPLFREAESDLTLVMLLKASTTDMEDIKQYELTVNKAIDNIYKSEQLNLEEVCSFMASGLKIQTGQMDKSIQLANFTYQDTKMGSPFSRRLIRVFEKELVEEAKYKIQTDFSYTTKNIKLPHYILTGTYWEDGESLKIIAILRERQSLKTIASVDGILPKKWLNQNNISYLPENYEDALASMMAFKKDEITGSGLKLEVWTNKGDDSPVFYEGDTLRFYIRVNNECYVRIINHFADGTRILLVDNMYIGSDKVNKAVKIPREFLCASPFGIEVLQVNAQSVDFNPLYTESSYGYDFIKEDLTAILKNTRGFKPIKNEDLKAEKRIVVTTMNK